jgi:hypothetical protein
LHVRIPLQGVCFLVQWSWERRGRCLEMRKLAGSPCLVLPVRRIRTQSYFRICCAAFRTFTLSESRSFDQSPSLRCSL